MVKKQPPHSSTNTQENNRNNNADPTVSPNTQNTSDMLQIQKELEKVQAELQESKRRNEQLLYSLANRENMIKRLEKENNTSRTNMTNIFLRNIIKNALDPLEQGIDNIENIKEFNKNTSEQVILGLRMIEKKMHNTLKEFNVEKMSTTVGSTFNFEQQEAIGIQETDKDPPGTVLKECSPGYAIKGKIFRPAQVIVAAQPKQQNNNGKTTDN